VFVVGIVKNYLVEFFANERSKVFYLVKPIVLVHQLEPINQHAMRPIPHANLPLFSRFVLHVSSLFVVEVGREVVIRRVERIFADVCQYRVRNEVVVSRRQDGVIARVSDVIRVHESFCDVQHVVLALLYC
jgi:hypothetical protein